jgi:hypothetical protein
MKTTAHFVIASVFLEMQAHRGSEFRPSDLRLSWQERRPAEEFAGNTTYTILFYPSLIPMKMRQFR